jgi:hypothetical protein
VQSISGFTTDWQIIEAKFNCPDMTSLASAFAYIKRLEFCNFLGTMNSLTSLSMAFAYCHGLRKLIWPTSMNLCSNLYRVFYSAKCKLKIVFPALPALENLNYAFYDSYLTEIEFTGPSNSLTNMAYVAQAAVYLVKFVFPTSVSALQTLYQAFTGDVALTRIDLPTGQIGTSSSIIMTNWLYDVKLHLLNNSPTWTTALTNFQGVTASFLTEFNQPTLRCDDFRVNGTSANPSEITELIFDIENSFSSGTKILYATYLSLSVDEINRIFTELPVVASGTIDVRNNPGYAGCAKSIATSKGWTVN